MENTHKVLIREVHKFRPYFMTATSDYFKANIGADVQGIEVIIGDSSQIYLPDEKGIVTVPIHPSMIQKD